jgi:Flp pilus assembly protein TadG
MVRNIMQASQKSRRLSHCFNFAVSPSRARRRGAAAVEFALVAPLLFMVFLGIVEFGRAFTVAEMLNSAARHGVRTGVVSGATNTNVTAAVNQNLTGITGATTTILVNSSQLDVSKGVTGDSITVTVSIAYSKVSLLPHPSYLGQKTISASAVMRKE